MGFPWKRIELRDVIIGDAQVRTCHACGCDDLHACEGGCSWVADDLCSACLLKRSRWVPFGAGLFVGAIIGFWIAIGLFALFVARLTHGG